MLLGNIVDQLLDKHCLADTRTTEKADFSALKIRFEQVNDLDSGVQHLLGGTEMLEFRCFPVDGEAGLIVKGSKSVDSIARDIHHAASDIDTRRHRNRSTGGNGLLTALQTVGRIHCHTSDGVLANVLLHFDDDTAAVGARDCQCIVDGREKNLVSFRFKMHIHDRSYNLRYSSCKS